ncbi:MAG: hypothetical protein EOM20_08600, partial [Spartobacteria bacterium]|nr:hypothetical protein [Spartobacteria bacterium]
FSVNESGGSIRIIFAPGGSGAQSVWKGSGADSLWSTAENWVGDVVPPAESNVTFYTGIGSGTNIYLNGERTVAGLIFNDSADTALNIRSNALTINDQGISMDSGAAGAHRIYSDVYANEEQAWMNASTQTLTLYGGIHGTNPLRKTGSGTIYMGSTNIRSSGGLWIDEGALYMNMGGGYVTRTNQNIYIGTNAAWWVQSANNFNNIATAHVFSAGSPANPAVRMVSSASWSRWPHATIQHTDMYFKVESTGGAYGTAPARFHLHGHTLYFNAVGYLDMEGSGMITGGSKLDGDGAIYKTGSGRFQIAGYTTLTGSVHVVEGDFRLVDSTALPRGGTLYLEDGVAFSRRSSGGMLNNNKAMCIRGNVTMGSGSWGVYSYRSVDMDGGLRALSFPLSSGSANFYGSITNGGLAQNGPRDLYLYGTNTYALGTEVRTGALYVTSYSLPGDAQVYSNASLVFMQSQTGICAGVLSGAGTLWKTNTGALMLTASSTLTGQTTVGEGTLIQNGTNTASPVWVLTNGVLAGAGQIGELSLLGGVAGPGTNVMGIGRLQVSGLSLSNGAALRIQLGDFDNTSDRDYFQNSGSVTLGGEARVCVDSGLLSNWDNTQDRSWTIIAGGVASSAGFVVDSVTHWSEGSYPKNGGYFKVRASGGNLMLDFHSGAPGMIVLGTNMGVIANGDLAPTTVDGTDFGVVSLRGSVRDHTFVITNNGGGVLRLTNGMVVGGTHATNFIVLEQPEPYVGLNLISSNPDFEQGGADWNTWGSEYEYRGEYWGMTPRRGTNMLTMWNGAGVWRDLPVSVGETYVFSVWVASPPVDGLDGGRFGEIKWEWYASDGSTQVGAVTNTVATNGAGSITIPAGQWVNITTNVTAPGGAAYGRPVLSVGESGGSSGRVIFDNVQALNLLGGDGTTSFKIRFDPSQEGAHSALVYITNNVSGGSPYTFALNGTGVWSIIYDGFGNSGRLYNQGGGTEWGTNLWACANDDYHVYDSGSMPSNSWSYARVTGNKIKLDATANGSIRYASRKFEVPITTGVVYFSWIQNFDHAGGANRSYAGLYLMSNDVEMAFAGKAPGTTVAGLYWAGSAPDTNSLHEVLNGVGNDYVFVGRYDFSSRALCLNVYGPDEVIAEEPKGYWDVTNTLAAGHIQTITGIRLKGGIDSDPINNIGNVYFDEVRVGFSWMSVARRYGESHAEQLNDGPHAKLIYVGTNYTVGATNNLVITDGEVANTSDPLDFAVLWYNDYGVFMTNNNGSYNIGSREGRVNPNWDPVTRAGSGEETQLGLDRFFTNFVGYNGALAVTTYVHSAFSITNSSWDDTYYITASAETDPQTADTGGTFASPNGANDIPFRRAITVNSNLEFSVVDDDTAPPIMHEIVYTNQFLPDPGLEASNTYWGTSGQPYATYIGTNAAETGLLGAHLRPISVGWHSQLYTYNASTLYGFPLPVPFSSRLVLFASLKKSPGLVESVPGNGRVELRLYTYNASGAVLSTHVTNLFSSLTTNWQQHVFFIDCPGNVVTGRFSVYVFGCTDQVIGNYGTVYADNLGLDFADNYHPALGVSLGAQAIIPDFSPVRNYTITDRDLARVTVSDPMRLCFWAWDTSSVAHAAGGYISNVMSVSVGNFTTNNTAQFAAAESSATMTGLAASNVWTFTSVPINQIEDMFQAVTNEVRADLWDADNDRSGDQMGMTNVLFGNLVVHDNDVEPPGFLSSNLLVNGAFEGGLGSWTYNSPAYTIITNDNPKEGYNCVAIKSDDTFESVWQGVSATSHVVYGMSLWCRMPEPRPTNANLYMKLEAYNSSTLIGTNQVDITSGVSSNWASFTHSIFAPSNTTSIRAVFGFAGNTTTPRESFTSYWDNASLSVGSEPLMLFLGTSNITQYGSSSWTLSGGQSYLQSGAVWTNARYRLSDEQLNSASVSSPLQFHVGVYDYGSGLWAGSAVPARTMTLSIENWLTDNFTDFDQDYSTPRALTHLPSTSVWSFASVAGATITALLDLTNRISMYASDADNDRISQDWLVASNSQIGYLEVYDDDVESPVFVTGVVSLIEGDFENYALATNIWTVEGVNSDIVTNSDAASGTNYVRIWNNGGRYRYAMQHVGVVPGAGYRQVYSARHTGSAIWDSGVKVLFFDAEGTQVGYGGGNRYGEITTSWQAFTNHMTAPVNAAYACVMPYMSNAWGNAWVHYDNLSFVCTNVNNWPAKVEIGSQKYYGATGDSSELIEVLDGTLAGVSGANLFKVRVDAYDEYSGLQRSIAGNASTQMNLSLGALAVNNIVNYDASLSSISSTSLGSQSYWSWDAISSDQIEDLYAAESNAMEVVLWDADMDRTSDQLGGSNYLMGWLRVLDDDTNHPVFHGYSLEGAPVNRTNLQAGDIAIIGYQAQDTDRFAFAALVDIPEFTQITFTDSGWSGAPTDAFNGGEGSLLWTSPTGGIFSGVVVEFTNMSTASPYVSTGTVAKSGSWNLGATDSILAYQGEFADPRFIYGVLWNGAWGGAESDLPSHLTNGITALYFPGAAANGYYGSPLDMFDFKSVILTNISTQTTWTVSGSAQSWPARSFLVANLSDSEAATGFSITGLAQDVISGIYGTGAGALAPTVTIYNTSGDVVGGGYFTGAANGDGQGTWASQSAADLTISPITAGEVYTARVVVVDYDTDRSVAGVNVDALTLTQDIRIIIYDNDAEPAKVSNLVVMVDGVVAPIHGGAGTSNVIYQVTDGDLLNAGTAPISLSFEVYDTYSGIPRNTVGPHTNMNVSVEALTTLNVSNYSASRSTLNTKTIGSTSVWVWAENMSPVAVSNLYGEDWVTGPASKANTTGALRMVRANVPDADDDRPGDMIWRSNVQFGVMHVIDDDINSPVFGQSPPGNLLRNPDFEEGSVRDVYGARHWHWDDPDRHGSRWGSANWQGWGGRSGGADTNIAAISGTEYNGDTHGGWWQDVPATPLQTYEAGAWFWSDAGTFAPIFTASYCEVKIEFFNVSGGLLNAQTNHFSAPGETWVLHSVTGVAPAAAARVRAVFAAVNTSAGGALRLDDAWMEARSVTNLAMDISIGSQTAEVSTENSFYGTGTGTNALFMLTDGDLARIGPANPLTFRFNVCDPESGVARSALTEELNFDIGGIGALQNIYSTYAADRSTADATSLSSSSLFVHVNNFTVGGYHNGTHFAETGEVYHIMDAGTNRVTVSAPNADEDRGLVDREWSIDWISGGLVVTDDDTEGPFATLLYVGSNYTGTVGINELTDEEFLNRADFAFLLEDKSGLFVTNNSGVNTNVWGNSGNVNVNVDFRNPEGAQLFENLVVTNLFAPNGNGSFAVTGVVFQANDIGITVANNMTGMWALTVSSQDMDNDRGTVLHNDGEVNLDRAVSIDQPLSFLVVDDDQVAPTVTVVHVVGTGGALDQYDRLIYFDFGGETLETNAAYVSDRLECGPVRLFASGAPAAIAQYAGNPGQSVQGSGGFKDTNKYWSVSVVVDPGFTLLVTNLALDYRSTATGPDNWVMCHVANNVTTAIASATMNNDSAWRTNVAAVSMAAVTGSNEFWIAGGAAGTGGGTWAIDNLAFLGHLQSQPGAGFVSDYDVANGLWTITGLVQDVHSGVYALGDPLGPRYSIFTPTGAQLVTNKDFTTGPAVNGQGTTAIALADAMPALPYDGITLGTYTGYLYVSDYDVDRIDDSLSITQRFVFTVVDDDDEAPWAGSIFQGMTDKSSVAHLHGSMVVFNGANLTSAAGSRSNRTWYVTDRMMVNAATTNVDLHFNLFDPSGYYVSSIAGGSNLTVSIDNLLTNNSDRFNAARSTANNVNNPAATSVWSFTSFSDAEMLALMETTSRVTVSATDMDNDREDDRQAFSNKFMGNILWRDNDAGAPRLQTHNDFGSNALHVTLGLTPGNTHSFDTYLVNAGGGAYTDSQSRAWSSDAGFFNTGNANSTASAIAGTDMQALYQSERWDGGESPEMLFSFPVEPGDYRVRLHFAEIYSGASSVGDRVFDVKLNGQTVLTDYDIVADVGYLHAAVQEFIVEATSSVLTVEFIHKVENPKVSAIEVLKLKDLWESDDTPGDSASQVYRISDAQLASVSATNQLIFRFHAFDIGDDNITGLLRANTFTTVENGRTLTNTHISVGPVIQSNAANYRVDWSSSIGSTRIAAHFPTSVWAFTSFAYDKVGEFLPSGAETTNPIILHAYDADNDRNFDQASTNIQAGNLVVYDDDAEPPVARDLLLNYGEQVTDEQIRFGFFEIALTLEDASGIGTNNADGNWAPLFNLINPEGEVIKSNFQAKNMTSLVENFSWRVTTDYNHSSVDYDDVVTGVYAITWSAHDLDDDRPNDRMEAMSSTSIVGMTNTFLVIDDDVIPPTAISNVVVQPASWTNKNYFMLTYEGADDVSGIYEFRSLAGAAEPTSVTDGEVLPRIDVATNYMVQTGLWSAVSNASFELGYNGLEIARHPAPKTFGWYNWSSSEGGYAHIVNEVPAQDGSNVLRLAIDEGLNAVGQGRFALAMLSDKVKINNTKKQKPYVELRAHVLCDLSHPGVWGHKAAVSMALTAYDEGGSSIYWDAPPDPPEWTGLQASTWTQLVIFVTNAPAETEWIGFRLLLAAGVSQVPATCYWDNLSYEVSFRDGGVLFTNAPLGVTTNWLFAVDDDDDRANDRLKSANTNFVFMFDDVPPPQIVNIVGDDGPDETSEVELRWDPSPNAGGVNLSPWRSYRVYYTEEARDATTNDPYFAAHNSGHTILDSMTTDSVILSNFIFGLEYTFAVAGEDTAGNISMLSSSVVHYFSGFFMTQGVEHATGGQVGWTAHDNEGVVDRPYDVIYQDAYHFTEITTSRWEKMATVTNSYLVDNTVGALPSGSMRLYRAAQVNRWQTNRSPRIASAEIYGMKKRTLYPGQNWIQMPFVPDTATVSFVFGMDLPGGVSGMDPNSTHVSWYERTADKYATNEVFMCSDGHWYYIRGGTGVADNKLMPLHEGILVVIPTNSTAQELLLIGKVPTNSPQREQSVKANAYNFVGYNMPRYTHPAQLQLDTAGFRASALPFPWPGMTDTIIIWNSASQSWREIWKDNSGKWRYTFPSPSFPLVPTNAIAPDNALLINTIGSTVDIEWENPPLYPDPTREMNP